MAIGDLKRRIVAQFAAENKAKGELASFRSDVDKTGQAMKRMAKGALSAVGLGGGLYALKQGFDYVTKAAMKQEDALFLLEAALKASGEYTSETMKGFEAFAASIQKATVYGDEEVLSLMQLMKSLGVTSTGLEQATRMAIGLAAATGRDVRSMSMYIALAQQGEFTMLRRYIPALRSTTDATEQLRIITEFAANGFKIAEAQAETTSGSIKQMWNAVSDLAEVMGKPITDKMAEDTGNLTILIAGATGELKKFQEAVEKAEKASRKTESMRGSGWPTDFPLGVPMIHKGMPEPVPELYVSPRGMERLAEMDANIKKAEALKKTIAEQDAMMQEHMEKIGGMYGRPEDPTWEMQERMTRQRIETEIALVTQQMEAETEVRKKAAEQAVRIAEDVADRQKRISEDYAMAMAGSWSSAIDQMMFEGKKFWDAMTDMARSLVREIANIIMYKKLAEPFAYGIMGLPVPGTTPSTSTPAWTGAPSQRVGLPQGGGFGLQHGGTVLETGWAKVHKGETYSGVGQGGGGGGGGGSIDVHIHNEGQEKLEISRVESYIFSDKRIIDVTTKAMQTDIRYRRNINQARQ